MLLLSAYPTTSLDLYYFFIVCVCVLGVCAHAYSMFTQEGQRLWNPLELALQVVVSLPTVVLAAAISLAPSPPNIHK